MLPSSPLLPPASPLGRGLSRAVLSAFACLAVVRPAFLLAQTGKAAPSPAEARAEAALAPLAERFQSQRGDRDKLSHDLRTFRFTHPGTRAAVKAADMLSQLPSPLDKLNPADIPALERFAWQPKELVGILGEHRGRHGAAVSCVAYSSDGKIVVSGGAHLVRLWDARTYRLLSALGSYSVTSIALARDGKNVAAGTASGA